jgi:LytS/YehU family sensor histidine kinase
MWEVTQGTIIFFAWSSTYMFIKQWIISLENKTNLENAVLKTENFQLKFLRNQLNPHFLFNSLNILNSMISDENTNAKKFVKNFSKIYHYVLVKGDCNIVSISEEIDFIESYLFLLQERHQGKIFYSIDKFNTNVTFILPMALQLLVENAIKHNTATTHQPLRINIYKDDEFIVVKNNINPKNSSVNKSQLGLNNLSERYKYMTSKDIEIKETDKDFIVKLPIIQHEG